MKIWKMKTIHGYSKYNDDCFEQISCAACILYTDNAIRYYVLYRFLILVFQRWVQSATIRHIRQGIYRSTFVGHRLYSRFVDITKEGNGSAGLGERFCFQPGLLYFRVLILIVGCWLLVDGCLFWLSVVSAVCGAVVGCRVLVVTCWLSIVGCRCRWMLLFPGCRVLRSGVCCQVLTVNCRVSLSVDVLLVPGCRVSIFVYWLFNADYRVYSRLLFVGYRCQWMLLVPGCRASVVEFWLLIVCAR